MAPKKDSTNKKAVQKEAKQIIEDKTFGLKNKNKSKKVQEYVKYVQQNVNTRAQTIINRDKPAQSVADIQRIQREEEKKQQQLALLRSTLKQPKLAEGEDPKSVMCIYFYYGCCDKGDKCKHSHGAKVQLYTEQEILEEKLKKEVEKEAIRQREMGFVSEDMGSLDVHRDMRDQILEFRAYQQSIKNGRLLDEVLEELKYRENEKTKNLNKSDKICDHFIQACRDGIIGFGWVCPNERTEGYCKYRHWIPVDFQLFKIEELDEDLDHEELETMIERKRQEIVQGTPVTNETFAIWKAKRVEYYKYQVLDEEAKREKEGTWSGRYIFERGLYRRSEDEEDCGTDDFMANWKQAYIKRKEDELRIERAETERLEKQFNEGNEKKDEPENELQDTDNDGTEEQEEK